MSELTKLIEINKTVVELAKTKKRLVEAQTAEEVQIEAQVSGLAAPFMQKGSTTIAQLNSRYSSIDFKKELSQYTSLIKSALTLIRQMIGKIAGKAQQGTTNQVLNDILKHIAFYHVGYLKILTNDFDKKIPEFSLQDPEAESYINGSFTNTNAKQKPKQKPNQQTTNPGQQAQTPPNSATQTKTQQPQSAPKPKKKGP